MEIFLMVITFEIYDQGLDILVNNNVVSFQDLSQLKSQVKSARFKKRVRDNLNIPIDANVEFDNRCKTLDSFSNNLKQVLSWIYS